MSPFAASDFVPLDLFSLGWRFSADRAGEIPSGTKALIRPLSSVRAETLAEVARSGGEESTHGETFRSDEAPGSVRARLAALPPHPETEILVRWDAATAIVTEWWIFVAHWDDFCYPASDDVAVRPFDESWVLWYRHYEIFQFRPGTDVVAPT